jgi:hypothetical protein
MEVVTLPGCAVHFEIAARVMRHWELTSSDAPFPLLDPDARSAFVLGSLGPDLGYFPGADTLLADLAHCVRTADLARNLIRLATTTDEVAFAWGWATHVLADIWIHPLINQAVGLITEPRPPRAASFADDRATHIRVETGLDSALPASDGWAIPPKFGPGTATQVAPFIAKAYRTTYGFTPSERRLRMTLRLARPVSELLLLNGAVASGRPSGLFGRRAIRLVAGLARTFRSGGLLAAFTNPVPPPDWLMHDASGLIARFPEQFQPYHATKFSGLPNTNLDTGQLEAELPDYAVTQAALAELARRKTRNGP